MTILHTDSRRFVLFHFAEYEFRSRIRYIRWDRSKAINCCHWSTTNTLLPLHRRNLRLLNFMPNKSIFKLIQKSYIDSVFTRIRTLHIISKTWNCNHSTKNNKMQIFYFLYQSMKSHFEINIFVSFLFIIPGHFKWQLHW